MTIDGLTRREFLGLGVVTGIGLAVPELVFGGGQELTPTQEENLKKYRYPWDEVYTKRSDVPQGKVFRRKSPKSQWANIYFNNTKVRHMFRDAKRMHSLMQRITDSNISNGELRFILLTDDNEIVYNIQTCNNPHINKIGDLICHYVALEKIGYQNAEILRNLIPPGQ